MDPASITAIVSVIAAIIMAILNVVQYKRGQRDKLGQAEATELADSIKSAPNDPPLKLRIDEREG